MLDFKDCFEYVVIGSGFGGTISTLTIANKLEEENKCKNNTEIVKKICVIERGQWWLNPEKVSINYKEPPIQEYLDNSNNPYGFFPYPDNSIGLIQAMKNFRSPNNTKGIYDFRSLKNIRTIAGSGVGGGSQFTSMLQKDPTMMLLDIGQQKKMNTHLLITTLKKRKNSWVSIMFLLILH